MRLFASHFIKTTIAQFIIVYLITHSSPIIAVTTDSTAVKPQPGTSKVLTPYIDSSSCMTPTTDINAGVGPQGWTWVLRACFGAGKCTFDNGDANTRYENAPTVCPAGYVSMGMKFSYRVAGTSQSVSYLDVFGNIVCCQMKYRWVEISKIPITP